MVSCIPTGYHHVELFLPDEAGCSWGGLGALSGRQTWQHSAGGRNPGIRVHELGHSTHSMTHAHTPHIMLCGWIAWQAGMLDAWMFYS